LARRVLWPALLVALLAAAPVARADGDPASDYLLGQQTFVPPDAGIPAGYANQLLAAVQAAKARGYTIRVALIGSTYDLGAVGSLWKKPKEYARFLGQELAFVYKGRLLVVMPNGLAVSRDGKALAAEQRVVDRIPPPTSGGRALAAAGTQAVIRLAANAGLVVPTPKLSGATSNGSPWSDRLKILGGVALGVVVFLAVLFVPRLRRRAST
jgi:hypothetical protein